MGLDVAAVMTEVGNLLKKISGLRVFDYQAASLSGETAIVDYPDQINYNLQYGPEGFRFDLRVGVFVPNPTERRTRDKLVKYAATSGAYSVKVALESPIVFNEEWTGYGVFDYATVKEVFFDPDTYTYNQIEYAGALFLVDIAGS